MSNTTQYPEFGVSNDVIFKNTAADPAQNLISHGNEPSPSSPLIPAITFGSCPDPEPKPHMIFVDGDEGRIVERAEAIEKAAYLKTLAACPDGMQPAVYFTEGTSEMERSILAEAKRLREVYQKKLHTPLLPVLVPSLTPEFQPIPTVITDTNEPDRPGKSPVPPAQGEKFGSRIYTDLELAQLFIRRIHVRRRGQQIYAFNGQYYKALNKNELDTLILQSLRNELNEIGCSGKIHTVAEAIMAEPDILVQEHEMDPTKICLLNGVLDMSTLQLLSHNPSYFLDWQLNSHWAGSESSCPAFEKYLWDVTGGNTTLLSRFWQATGYLLVGAGNIAKRIFILTGPSDAGKSVYGSLLRHFHHGEQISSIDAFKMGDRFSTSALVKARLNLAMDLPHGALSEQAVGMLKSISGSDAVTIEAKYQPPYTAKLDCKLVFATNHPIRATIADRALARRLMVLPFQYSVPKNRQDPFLLERLLAERPAILYRAIQAYYELMANHFIFEGDDQFNNNAFLGIEADPDTPTDEIEQFTKACCVRAASDWFTPTGQLHEAYQTYCKSKGYRCIGERQAFSARLRPILEAKFQARRDKKRVGGIPTNGYRGVRLISEFSQAAGQ